MNESGSKLKPSALPSTPADTDPEASPAAFNGNLDDLHNLFVAAAPADADEEDPLAQLRNDPNYAALIRDLEYIATQARLLFTPAEEAPSDEVWNKIQIQLSSETKKP